MCYITKQEKNIKSINNEYSIVNGKLTLNEEYMFNENFHEGDIVTLKNDNDFIGIIEYIEDEIAEIVYNNGEQITHNISELVNIHPTLGIKLLQTKELLNLWEELSNGKSNDLDLKCIYIDNLILNEVKFIKYLKNINRIIDYKFKREFLLHKKIGAYKIYKTGTYSIKNNEITYIEDKFVYYLIDKNFKAYYIGFDIDVDKICSEIKKHN